AKVVLDLKTDVDSVRIDSQPLEKSAWGAPIVLDPGPHAFEFSAAGKKTETRSIVVQPGPSSQTVTVGPFGDEGRPAQPPAPTPVKQGGDGGGTRTVGFVVGGAGVVAVAVGAAFGLMAVSNKNDADASCQGRFACPRQGYDANNAAHTDATISTV